MQWLGQFHPQIVHTPVALLVFSAFFAVVGRLYDREWIRKTSAVLLVFGFLGAFAAVRSGAIAHRVPEHQQGVPEHAIDEHEEAAQWTLYLSGAAVLMVFLAARLKDGPGKVASGVALVLQLMTAASVARTGYLGGQLVYDHGANVRIGGVLVKDVPGAAAGEHDADKDADEKR